MQFLKFKLFWKFDEKNIPRFFFHFFDEKNPTKIRYLFFRSFNTSSFHTPLPLLCVNTHLTFWNCDVIADQILVQHSITQYFDWIRHLFLDKRTLTRYGRKKLPSGFYNSSFTTGSEWQRLLHKLDFHWQQDTTPFTTRRNDRNYMKFSSDR